jgi:hypothetical protein
MQLLINASGGSYENSVPAFPRLLKIEGAWPGQVTLSLAFYHEDHLYYTAPDITTITVVDVDLEKMPTGNTPDLVMGRMCVNATNALGQPYSRAKYVARIYGGGTASASSVGARAVTFEGINGSDPEALTDGQMFWAIADGPEIGQYTVRLTHSCSSTVTDEESETIFKFQFSWEKCNQDGESAGQATVDHMAGTIDAPHLTTHSGGLQNAGSVRWHYNMWVDTEPTHSYVGGHVRADAHIDFLSNAEMGITRCNMDYDSAMGIGVSFGIVSVSLAPESPPEYGNSVVAADTSIEVADGGKFSLVTSRIVERRQLGPGLGTLPKRRHGVTRFLTLNMTRPEHM